ncbi:MAG: hypothetical protein WD873_00780 [Candidatus Hydrogenedentales bacterium]
MKTLVDPIKKESTNDTDNTVSTTSTSTTSHNPFKGYLGTSLPSKALGVGLGSVMLVAAGSTTDYDAEEYEDFATRKAHVLPAHVMLEHKSTFAKPLSTIVGRLEQVTDADFDVSPVTEAPIEIKSRQKIRYRKGTLGRSTPLLDL